MDIAPLLAILAIVFGLAVIVFMVAVGVLERRSVSRALRTVTWDDPAVAELRQRELAIPATQRVLLPALQRVSDRVTRLAPSSVVDRLDEELAYGGGVGNWDGERVLAVKALLAAGLPITTLALAVLLGVGVTRAVVVAGLAAFVGYYLPEWVLRSRSSRRQRDIQRALPDALDLLSITVEAGLGFDAAIDRVAREIRGPLGGELYRMVQEMRLGKARSDALRDLGERSSVPELRSFVLAMVQAEIFGISIANVLQVQAQELRLKRRQRAEEQAQKLPVKIIFPLLFGIFPALFVVLLGPATLSIYDNIISQ